LLANALPPRLASQIQHRPYAVIAGAFVVGGSLGVVLSSRILRSILTATATATAIELMRAFVQQNKNAVHAG
jgi:acetyl-CoA carboxylase beta subunit